MEPKSVIITFVALETLNPIAGEAVLMLPNYLPAPTLNKTCCIST